MLQIEKRILITIQGRVQGVGFRPFVYRLAHAFGLPGSIRNTSTGVVIDIQGMPEKIEEFQKTLLDQKPKHASIDGYFAQDLLLADYQSFQIASSTCENGSDLALLPDTAICSECRFELFDPKNRRCLYPFLHCVSCGPRFSLFSRMPFDRQNTTMRNFSMCKDCEAEYTDPGNRRFYSQTNCCPKCGPKLELVDANRKRLAAQEEIFSQTARLLSKGKIIAMKNTGGYLLLVDAANEEAVMRLRRKKRRLHKPFAILLPSLEDIDDWVFLFQKEKDALQSAAAPIVLLRKKGQGGAIAPSVSPQSPYHGVMLAHNPIQLLIQKHFPKPLVATSGNASGIPLCMTEDEAFSNLANIADCFLIHNREIARRLDDSIVQVIADQTVVMRKARGLIPCSVSLAHFADVRGKKSVFAAGGHMKNGFAFEKNGRIYMSQYMGDLTNAEQCRSYEDEVNQWEKLLGVENIESVGDLHPDYYSSLYLSRKDSHSLKVQHHQAHIWSGMIDCQISPPFLGVAWDGTGLGVDATVWGGEIFVVFEKSMKRVGSLFPFRLPGGEKAMREPRRSMLGVFDQLFNSDIPLSYQQQLLEMFSNEELAILLKAVQKGINSPVCSSVGRLFDAMSAILKLCKICDYEGQGAQLLENASYDSRKRTDYFLPILESGELILLDWRPMVKKALSDFAKGRSLFDIAMGFHEALADGILQAAKHFKLEKVLLTGGVMQNKLLVEKTAALLKKEGFIPYFHRDIPPNDSGIAVGQIMGRFFQRF